MQPLHIQTGISPLDSSSSLYTAQLQYIYKATQANAECQPKRSPALAASLDRAAGIRAVEILWMSRRPLVSCLSAPHAPACS